MKVATNRTLRRIHHYLGVFFAPLIIFFAVSGALQTFRLNEQPGAPRWMQWAASLHKDQAAPRPPRAPRPPAPGPRRPEAAPRHDPFALKILVGIMSLGLIAAAALGIAIALSVASLRRGAVVMLVLGTLLPVFLLLA